MTGCGEQEKDILSAAAKWSPGLDGAINSVWSATTQTPSTKTMIHVLTATIDPEKCKATSVVPPPKVDYW